jgi:hypothetical protein
MFVLKHGFLGSIKAFLSTAVSLKFLLPVIVMVVFFAIVNMAHSYDLTFTWSEETGPDRSGYRLYERLEYQNYDYNIPAWEGSETTCTIYGLADHETYCFVARAYDVYGYESQDSVEVCYDPEMIERLKPWSSEPAQPIKIIGKGFGDGVVGAGTPSETNSVVHVGAKEFEYGHPRIKLWTDTKIELRIPGKKYLKNSCQWFKGKEFRAVDVWVTVGSLTSNKKQLEILRPATCPEE